VQGIVAGALVALGVTAGAPAGADVTPTGPVTLTLANGQLHMVVNGTPTDVGPFSGTMTGTVAPDGTLHFPQGNVSFDPLSTTVVVPAEIELQPTSDWTGTVNPDGKTVTLAGSLVTLVTIPSIGFADCQVGPISLAPAGNNYDATNGKATLRQNGFQVGAVPPGTPGCLGLESVINTALNLPGPGSLTWPVTLAPALKGTGTATTTTTATTVPETTTVAPPVTPATEPPPVAPAADALPRTGSEPFLAVLGAALVAGGAALVARARRRPLLGD
jgi:LPXTG-motif cell wall-anchored protein